MQDRLSDSLNRYETLDINRFRLISKLIHFFVFCIPPNSAISPGYLAISLSELCQVNVALKQGEFSIIAQLPRVIAY